MPAAERCQRGIARTFQVVKSFETMTVIDNVIVGALIRTTVMREARRKAYEVLEFCRPRRARQCTGQRVWCRRRSAASKSRGRSPPNRSCCCLTKCSPV